MINQLGQVMLYVNDQDKAKAFWTEKLNFKVISDTNEGMRIITLAPQDDNQTQIVLHNKHLILQMQPELNTGTPSLMFYANHLEQLYIQFKELNITVGELVSLPMGKVFNFADDEQNYFAIMER